MYYLLSRYYDPVTHRFLNADGVIAGVGSIQGVSFVGHGICDVIPYWLTGNSNTREQFEEKIFLFN